MVGNDEVYIWVSLSEPHIDEAVERKHRMYVTVSQRIHSVPVDY